MIRTAHRLCGNEMEVYHLLFADDGWLVGLGEHFWRRLLFWLFLLEVAEVPLSWKKVRGGMRVQWIGYTLDIENYTKGISRKKVQWFEDWVEKHTAAGGITGRDLKSALGRLSFVSGALQQIRPLLGPLYAWSAVLKGGTFAKFPDAVIVLLKFVLSQIKEEPMARAVMPKKEPVDVFRVDAKAEGELIVLGAWESYGGIDTKDAKWFSVRLTRKTAPWAYVKGDPFKTISSLELTATLLAVMIFSKGGKWRGERGRMAITSFTDSLVNAFAMQRFLSCKYPLSIVVMELAAQLRENALELDLQWIPRGQNEEADDLTNERFDRFDDKNRIAVDFTAMRFKVLDTLMEKAGQLDEDIALAKSSREAKQDRPSRTGEAEKKRKRGETKWKDPW